MSAALDRVSNRVACAVAAIGFGVSLLAAFLTPQEQELGAWVRLVIWHGMLLTATIACVLLMGTLAVAHVVTKRDDLSDWARALQLTLLPVWVLAVSVGIAAARLIWGAFGLTERRTVFSIGYAVVAALALMASLLWGDRRIGSAGQVVSSAAMALGLGWIALVPSASDVHPGLAIVSSNDPAFKLAALVMLVSCLVAVLALSVPVRRWLTRGAEEAR